jgi:hypothetical protein
LPKAFKIPATPVSKNTGAVAKWIASEMIVISMALFL